LDLDNIFLAPGVYNHIALTVRGRFVVYAPTGSTKEVQEKSFEFLLLRALATVNLRRHRLYRGHDIYHGHGTSLDVPCQPARFVMPKL
jgi:hypothetical protein